MDEEMWDARYIVVWSMATKTRGFKEDGLSTVKDSSLEVQYLKEVIMASIKMHEYRVKEREQGMQT